MKINNKKLEKYQNLFQVAGKLAGRVSLKSLGTHKNLMSAVSLFELEFNKFAFSKSCSDTPLAMLIYNLFEKSSFRDYDLYDIGEDFFNRIVLLVSIYEKVDIEYNYILGDFALYGSSTTSDFRDPNSSYREYLKFLTKKGFSGEDIFSSKTIVKGKEEVKNAL